MAAPLVSVGMPVFNAAKYVAASIETILAQTFVDWKLFISDNASSDGSWEIVTEYARRDPRIVAERSEVNRGMTWNFNRVFAAARGAYFMWQSDHDLRRPEYLARTIELFDRNPDSVLACSTSCEIDDVGAPVFRIRENADTRGLPPVARYRQTMTSNFCYKIYGLIRRETLAATGLYRPFYGTDALILADLALQGPFAQVDEPLFLPRINRATQSLSQAKVRNMTVLNPAGAAVDILRSWRDLRGDLRREHLALLRRSDLSRADRWEAMRATVEWFQLLYGV